MKSLNKQSFAISLALVVMIMTGCKDSYQPDPSNPDEIEDFIILQYKKKLNLSISKPAFVYSHQNERYTSTAYYNGYLYRMYVFDSGNVSTSLTEPLLPLGKIRVLSVIVNYPELGFEDLLENEWSKAQESINEDHLKLALEQGLDEPLLRFINYNLLIEPGRITTPQTENLEYLAMENGYNQDDYDVIAFIDLNQENTSGGFAVRKGSWIKMGWFYREDQGTEPDQEKLNGIAFAVYHHEIGHLFGWDHEWSDAISNPTFITEPALFGWIDVDNDGIPEILDPHPYGMPDP